MSAARRQGDCDSDTSHAVVSEGEESDDPEQSLQMLVPSWKAAQSFALSDTTSMQSSPSSRTEIMHEIRAGTDHKRELLSTGSKQPNEVLSPYALPDDYFTIPVGS